MLYHTIPIYPFIDMYIHFTPPTAAQSQRKREGGRGTELEEAVSGITLKGMRTSHSSDVILSP